MNINRNTIASVNSFANVAGVSAVQQLSTDSSSTSAVGAPQGDSFRSDFASILKAVQSGDIGSAQSALGALQNDIQGTSAGYSPTSTSSASTSSSPQNDLDALFKAVKSGDLTSAQSALSQLQTDSQNAAQQASGSQSGQQTGGHHHHHHGGGGGLASAVSKAFDSMQSTSTDSTDGSSSSDSTTQTASA